MSDLDLIATVARLVARESEATADLIEALAEFDARRLYLGDGCASLFVYCTGRLRLSESAAYHRITAARAVRRFPLITGSHTVLHGTRDSVYTPIVTEEI